MSTSNDRPPDRAEASKFTEDGVLDYERRRYRGFDQRIVHAREMRLVRKCFARILAAPGLRPDGPVVLDLPCGYGRFTDRLRDYARRLVASDLSFEMVRRAVRGGGGASGAGDGEAEAHTAACSAPRPAGAVANAKQGLPFKAGVFDVVFSVRFFHHVHDPLDRARILGEYHRVTSGWAIVSFYRANGLHEIQRRLRRRFHKSRTNIKMIEPGTFEKDAAAAGFDVVRVFPSFEGSTPTTWPCCG